MCYILQIDRHAFEQEEMMKTIILRLMVWFFFASLVLHGEMIEKIQIEGNKKVSKDTIEFYMKSKAEGPYLEDKLKDDFKALWETGFFENIAIEAENGKSGKIVKIKVNENPLISSVTYKIRKKIKESDITQKLQENNISLLAFSYYSPAKIKKIEKIIRAILLEKSYNEGKVSVEEKNEKGQIALTIQVDPGPKTKIGIVSFPGMSSKRFSSSFLRRGLKNNQPHSFLSMVMNKDVYNKEKIDEDLEEVRLRLQQRGYLEAKVGNPEFSMQKKLTVFGRAQNMMTITIPVELGPRYRLGNVVIEGNKTIKTDFLRAFLKLKKGRIYNVKKRNKAIEEMQKFYGSLGYFYCQVVPTENLDPVKQTADLTLRVQENDIVYLGKLEFKGNTFTKDHVIRREWFLREGRRLNMNALEDSIRRMKQLGLVTIEKMPEIKPDPQDPQKINITADVKELNRQMINFNVGYSGYQGWFIGAGYSTQNFLGMGETFALNLETGTRSKNYQFSFTEPYLFNLPASFGLSIFNTYTNYYDLYTRKGKGFQPFDILEILEILRRPTLLRIRVHRSQRCQRLLPEHEFLLCLLLLGGAANPFLSLADPLLFDGRLPDFPVIGNKISGVLPVLGRIPQGRHLHAQGHPRVRQIPAPVAAARVGPSPAVRGDEAIRRQRNTVLRAILYGRRALRPRVRHLRNRPPEHERTNFRRDQVDPDERRVRGSDRATGLLHLFL